MTSLTIVRGLPGSGKSTLVKRIKRMADEWFEADMYFEKDGPYAFDPTKLGAAHGWCQAEVDNALYYKCDVIVSNTFTTIRELRPYFEMAKTYDVVPNVITCQSNYGSVHGVPDETLDKMKARFVYDLSELFESLKD